MNILFTFIVYLFFIGFISEVIYRITHDYSEHPIIPEPNNILEEE